MEKKLEAFKNLISDEAIAKELFSIEKPEDARAYLAEHGVDFTLEEVKGLGEFLTKYAKKAADGELSEADLAEVAGGYSWSEFGDDAVTASEYIIKAVFVVGPAIPW